ncbi:MAG: fused MFS/spermidine synthase [Acidimicrobiales bacterium]|nr:fused MFS/spermidine synthase [Acidimicrobiales bacterium]
MVGLGGALVALGLVFALRHRRRPPVVALAAVLIALPISQRSSEPCQLETAYYCVTVEPDPERPTGRTLLLDNLRHSYVDLADPTYLQFRYLRLFAAVVDAHASGPRRALHIGGGGFTFPRWLAATRPGSDSTVLELDKDVLAVARNELGLRTGARLSVRTGDARLNIRDGRDNAHDLVVGDAFGGLSVPWHLTTVEMVREIERVLRDDGIYVLNVIDAGPRDLVRAVMATLREVFDHTLLLAPAGRVSGNHVLVASNAPITTPDIGTGEAVAVTGAQLDRFVANAIVLRDDFAPASQLITRDD